jgi:DNA-binding LytR/AlgR family response regulator
MNINIAICDDDEVILHEIMKKIKKANWKDNTITINIFTSGKDLIESIRKGIDYNVIFMDIDLHDNYLGTDTGMIIKMINPSILIIYVSSYDSYYPEIVKAEPFDFLKKPIEDNQLDYTIEKILHRLHYLHNSYLYTYKSNGMINTINLNEVKYFESQHRVIIVYLNNGSILRFYSKLDDVEQEVDSITPCFVRVNKSYLVNMHYIKNYSKNKVLLCDEDIELHLTHKYEENFLSKYLFNFVQKF